MSDSYHLIPVTVAGAFGVGMVLALLGSIKLALAKRLEIDEARVGALLAGLNLAFIPLMLISGLLVDALGAKWMILTGSLATGLALFGLAVSRTYRGAMYAVLAAGAGAALMSTASVKLMVPAFIPENKAASLNLGNVFFGLGALVTPTLADLLLRAIGFRRTVTILAGLGLAPALIAVLTTGYPDVKNPGDWSVLGQPFLWLCGLVFVFYMPLEGAIGTWATSYLTEMGHRERRAAVLLSGFWLAFLAARLVTGVLQMRGVLPPRSDPWLILGLALVAAVLLGNLAGTHRPGNAALGLLLVGACFGPVFPTLVGILFNYFPEAQHGTAYGAMFAIGTAGSLPLPPLIGAYARRRSIRAALRIPTVVALLLAGAALLVALVSP